MIKSGLKYTYLKVFKFVRAWIVKNSFFRHLDSTRSIEIENYIPPRLKWSRWARPWYRYQEQKPFWGNLSFKNGYKCENRLFESPSQTSRVLLLFIYNSEQKMLVCYLGLAPVSAQSAQIPRFLSSIDI